MCIYIYIYTHIYIYIYIHVYVYTQTAVLARCRVVDAAQHYAALMPTCTANFQTKNLEFWSLSQANP